MLFLEGTPRRKKKIVHQTAATDDKKLQSTLKKLAVNNIPGIEEVNLIKNDGSVIHFNNPKTQASLASNVFAITGHGEQKQVSHEREVSHLTSIAKHHRQRICCCCEEISHSPAVLFINKSWLLSRNFLLSFPLHVHLTSTFSFVLRRLPSCCQEFSHNWAPKACRT